MYDDFFEQSLDNGVFTPKGFSFLFLLCSPSLKGLPAGEPPFLGWRRVEDSIGALSINGHGFWLQPVFGSNGSSGLPINPK